MIMVARKNSLLRQLLLAATLAIGFATLWGVLVIWLGTSIHEAWSGRSRHPRETLVVTKDGTLLIQSMSLDNLRLVTYRDLNGREHDDAEDKDQLPAVTLSGERGTGVSFLSQPGWQQRIKIFRDEREPTAAWYFVHDGKPQGSGYFVGYERVSNRLIGSIGLAGFRAQTVPPDERIPVRGELINDDTYRSSWSSAQFSIYYSYYIYSWQIRPHRWDVPPRLVHVPSGNRLRVVDLAARTVTTVFEAPEPIVSVGVPGLSANSVGEPTKQRPILVRTAQTIYKLDHQYNVISAFTIPAEIDRHSTVTWYETDNGQAVAEFLGPRKTEEADEVVTKPMVYRVADDGAIRGSFELTLHYGWREMNARARDILVALGIPAPAALLAAESFMAMAIDPVQDLPAALGAMLRRSWPLLVGVLALSAVLATITWRRGCAFGLSRREQTTWAVFVLLFGFPAGVGFLLSRRWPVREPCPHCHARSPRDRDACAACGTPFPAPSLKGIEIFA